MSVLENHEEIIMIFLFLSEAIDVADTLRTEYGVMRAVTQIFKYFAP